MEPILRLDRINKYFPGVHANDDISLSVYPGEIHALIGENGSGKSTLMKIVYGLEQPDSGQIFVKGKPVRINTPKEAIALGIGMVHQDFMLVPSFTAAENIVLGLEPSEGLRLRTTTVNEKVRQLCEQFKMNIDPQAKTGSLPVGVQQRIEILKTLYRGVELLILDEPTAMLTPQEVEDLFRTMRTFAAEGRTLIFITHKLEEVMRIADRITVLRQGRVVGECKKEETTKEEIARMMVGRDVLLQVEKKPAVSGKIVLELQNVSLRRGGKMALSNINLNVASGEIVGVAGVHGNGQTELADVISGLARWDTGRIVINGEELAQGDPLRIREQGIAHIPENRDTQGLCLRFTISENAILGGNSRFSRRGFLVRRRIEAFAEDLVKSYQVKVPGLSAEAGTLSGGNKQKLIVAREVASDPDLLLACQPTRGVDVGAIEFIHERLVELRDQGMAILLISTELDEILALSDRIVVMFDGRIMGEVNRADATEERLGLMMAGAIEGEGQHEEAERFQVH